MHRAYHQLPKLKFMSGRTDVNSMNVNKSYPYGLEPTDVNLQAGRLQFLATNAAAELLVLLAAHQG